MPHDGETGLHIGNALDILPLGQLQSLFLSPQNL